MWWFTMEGDREKIYSLASSPHLGFNEEIASYMFLINTELTPSGRNIEFIYPKL